MAQKKIMLVTGLNELAKLEIGPAPIFKCVVERAHFRVGNKPMVMQTKDHLRPAVVIRATQQMVTICQPLPGEAVPVFLPRATLIYL